ncbi:metal ABC transporter solute-binding protein, Zn/Mn family, partial [Rhizobium ruizarguesonis]
KLIEQIKGEHVKAYFFENSNYPRLVKQVAKPTGAEPGGELYVESLSDAKGPAPTYEKIFKYNVDQLGDVGGRCLAFCRQTKRRQEADIIFAAEI